jgi:hypothetical protein
MSKRADPPLDALRETDLLKYPQDLMINRNRAWSIAHCPDLVAGHCAQPSLTQ